MTDDLDAILDTTLAELEETFGDAAGFLRFLAVKRDVAIVEGLVLEALGARAEP